MLKNKCRYSFWLLSQVRVLATRFDNPPSRETQVVSSSRSFCNSLVTRENFCDWTWQLAQSWNAQNQLFEELFSWETCFKPLPSSLKPLFQYFTSKPNQFEFFFHFINISKVILNSFHWFGFLDYVLVSFVLLVKIFIIGVGKT